MLYRMWLDVHCTQLHSKSDRKRPMDRCKDLRVSVPTSASGDVEGNKVFRCRVRGPEPPMIHKVEQGLLPFLRLKE